MNPIMSCTKTISNEISRGVSRASHGRNDNPGGMRGQPHDRCNAYTMARLRRSSFHRECPRNVAVRFIASNVPIQSEQKIDVLQQFSHLKLRGVPQRNARRDRVQSSFAGYEARPLPVDVGFTEWSLAGCATV